MQRSSSVDRLTRRRVIAAACSMLPLGASALAATRVRRPLGLCDTTVIKYLHLKDIDRSRGRTDFEHAATIGMGEMQYAALLPHIHRLTSAIGYVEVDAPDDGLEAAAQAARFIRDHR